MSANSYGQASQGCPGLWLSVMSGLAWPSPSTGPRLTRWKKIIIGWGKEERRELTFVANSAWNTGLWMTEAIQKLNIPTWSTWYVCGNQEDQVLFPGLRVSWGYVFNSKEGVPMKEDHSWKVGAYSAFPIYFIKTFKKFTNKPGIRVCCH